ncbi:hypothetical protein ACVWYO_001576 [Sphingomonas sp. UYP23]
MRAGPEPVLWGRHGEGAIAPVVSGRSGRPRVSSRFRPGTVLSRYIGASRVLMPRQRGAREAVKRQAPRLRELDGRGVSNGIRQFGQRRAARFPAGLSLLALHHVSGLKSLTQFAFLNRSRQERRRPTLPRGTGLEPSFSMRLYREPEPDGVTSHRDLICSSRSSAAYRCRSSLDMSSLTVSTMRVTRARSNSRNTSRGTLASVPVTPRSDWLCCKTDGGDSRRESSGIDRRNAQTCRTCVSYDELA